MNDSILKERESKRPTFPATAATLFRYVGRVANGHGEKASAAGIIQNECPQHRSAMCVGIESEHQPKRGVIPCEICRPKYAPVRGKIHRSGTT